MKENTKKTIKIYWKHILKYKFSGLVILFSVIAASTVNAVIPLYFKNFFDVLTSGKPNEIVAGSLITILIFILWLEILHWLFWRIATFSAAYFYSHTMVNLANSCFQYLHKHSYSYFSNNFVGSLVKRVNRFVRAFDNITDRITWNFLPLIVNIIIITAVLTLKNRILGIIVISWIILFLIINWFLTKYKLKYDIKRSRAETEATGILADTITNHSNVKLFRGYGREVKLFAKVQEKVRKLRQFEWNLNNIFDAVQGLLMVALEIGVFYLGIKLWDRGLFTVGDFVLLQSYVLIVFMKIWDFGRMIRRVYEDLADAEEMTEILDTPHEIKDARNAKELIVREGKIEFKNVDFSYHKTRKVLLNFSLKIKSKEKLALVGPSGAGKTTVIKLLLRMYDLTGGKILIDGQKITGVTQDSLWKNISLVPQDPILFHRSLMENIRYGKPEAADEEVIVAAKAAHCHEFISEFPYGYETYVGERGMKLSAGERQRVAIARAILRNAPILVLDEATSSLDSESESLIKDALDKLMEDKTVIAIAHRLSTIRKMDHIIVIDGGRIIEQGTHQQLIKKKDGKYRKLWELQAGDFIIR